MGFQAGFINHEFLERPMDEKCWKDWYVKCMTKNKEYQATVGVGEPVTEQARVMLRKVGLKRYLDPVSIHIKGK